MRNEPKIWYSAYGLSVMVHILLFIVVAVVQPLYASDRRAPEYIELDLVSSVSGGGGGGVGNGYVGGGGGDGQIYTEQGLQKILANAAKVAQEDVTGISEKAVLAPSSATDSVAINATGSVPSDGILDTTDNKQLGAKDISQPTGIGSGSGGGIGGGSGTGIGSGSGDGTGGGTGSGLGNGTGSGIGSGSGSGAGAGNGSGNGDGKGNGILAPRLLEMIEPDYPHAARAKGIEGTVIVKIEVLTNGRAGEIRVAESSGSADLDQAALQAVKHWRFVPAKVESGHAIVCYTSVPIVFRLT